MSERQWATVNKQHHSLHGQSRAATPVARPQPGQVLARNRCPRWLASFNSDNLTMSNDGAFLYGITGGTSWRTYDYPGLNFLDITGFSTLGFAEDEMWGFQAAAIDDAGYLYQWLNDPGFRVPCLVKYLPDGSSATKLYTWPYGIESGNTSCTWHPSDPDGIYTYEAEYTPTASIWGPTADQRILIRNDRNTGARTDIYLISTVFGDNVGDPFFGFVQYDTGFSIMVGARDDTGGRPDAVFVYDIPTETNAVLLIPTDEPRTEWGGWGGTQRGDLFLREHTSSPIDPFALHQARIRVVSGAVTITEVPVTCPRAFTVPSEFGDFEVDTYNWLSNGDRSLVLEFDGDELFDYSRGA